MSQWSVAPTKSNLIRARETLELAREGHDILDRKREVLTSELLRVADDARRMRSRVEKLLADAYDALQLARLVMGREHLVWAALSVNKTTEVEVRLSSIMGVPVPQVSAKGAPPEIPYGMGNTTVSLDEAATRFRHVLDEIPELAELITTVWRLARELQKTQRRVNALEHVFILEYEERVDYIESVLEEREREELFRLKRIKAEHGINRQGEGNR